MIVVRHRLLKRCLRAAVFTEKSRATVITHNNDGYDAELVSVAGEGQEEPNPIHTYVPVVVECG